MRAQRVVSLVTLLLCIFLQATSGAITDGPQGVQARVIPEPQGRPKMVAQLGHTYGVTGVAFSPRAGLLASGSFDKTIKIWEVVTGRELRSLKGHREAVSAVAFSPDGSLLASGSFDKTIKIWEVVTGRVLQTLSGHEGQVIAVVFSPGGNQLVSASSKTIRIWDLSQRRELRTLQAENINPTSLALSPDGTRVITGSGEDAIQIWETGTGKLLQTLQGQNARVAKNPASIWTVAYSPDGKCIAGGDSVGALTLWDAATGQEKRTLLRPERKKPNGLFSTLNALAFSPDGTTLASLSEENRSLDAEFGNMMVRIWDVATGQPLKSWREDTLSSGTINVFGRGLLAFSPNGKHLAAGTTEGKVKVWEVTTGQALSPLQGYALYSVAIAASPDGKRLAVGQSDHTIRLWDLTGSQAPQILKGHSGGIEYLAFRPDGRLLVSASQDQTLRVWDVPTGRELHVLKGHTGGVAAAAFPPNGDLLASGGEDETLRLWNVDTGKAQKAFPVGDMIRTLAFSPDGKRIAAGCDNDTIRVLDTITGRSVRTLSDNQSGVVSVAFSPDGKQLAGGSSIGKLVLWDMTTDLERLTRIRGNGYGIECLVYSANGKLLAGGCADGGVRLWEGTTGLPLQTLSGPTGSVEAVAFTPTAGLLFSASVEGTVKIWSVTTTPAREIGSLIAFEDGTWAVIDPQGRYDASNAGDVLGLHWVLGNESIDLAQLKDRYYEPGLLAKLLGFNRQPLRSVAAFTRVPLYPQVLLRPLDTHRFSVRLVDRGGGIGKVQVFVNNALFLDDARPLGTAFSAGHLDFNVDVSRAPTLRPGKRNAIRLLAYNAANWLASRGTDLVVTPQGPSVERPRHLYAIIAGISEYAAPELRLGFAAQDAEAFARAVRLGAARFFGADKIDITLLTTSGATGTLPPTHANLQRAFADLRKKAHPEDILLVYLAGHGLALATDNSTYCYLTQEANSADTTRLATDVTLRQQTTVTSAELADWINRIPASYRVMVLDTCAAGAAEGRLTDKREISGDQIRAMERFKDRTGFHLLMGCAADRVSYEASRYGQGVLTYALLQGMKGAALREGEWVDVRTLFGYAEDVVPKLAGDIGGIQQPRYHKPAAGSFDIGQLKPQDRQAIPLAASIPQVLRPRLGNRSDGVDDLELEKQLRARLLNTFDSQSRGGTGLHLDSVYIDAEELSGAIRPIGLYTVAGENVTVILTLLRDKSRVATLTVEGSTRDTDDLVRKMALAIDAAVHNLPDSATGP